MTPTRGRDLLTAVVLAALAARLLVGAVYSSLPDIPRSAPVSLVLVGFLELGAASAVRTRLRGGPGVKPITPLAMAKIALLARASSLAGAVSAGLWLGVLAYVVVDLDNGHHRHDAWSSGLTVAASALLVVAALRLERVCRAPDPEA